VKIIADREDIVLSDSLLDPSRGRTLPLILEFRILISEFQNRKSKLPRTPGGLKGAKPLHFLIALPMREISYRVKLNAIL
jgi:hypothetical protein